MNYFPHARFIWIKRKDRAQNRYLAFQKEFSLATAPAKAKLRISAYAYYQVAINGIVLGRGPDPSNNCRYYYDEYDAAQCLRRGRNFINVLAYAFGPVLPWPECSYLSGEHGWLAFEMEVESSAGRREVIASGSDCLVRAADAWKQRAPGYTELRAAYKEYYDASRFGYEALAPARAGERGWKRAVELKPSDLKFEYSFFPKEIKPFIHPVKTPAAAYAIDGGYAYGFTAQRGWQVENPEALVRGYPVDKYYEMVQKGEPNFPRRRMVTGAKNKCLVHKDPGCGTPSIWIDFGGMQYGTLCLELETAKGGSVIEIGYGESPHITYIDRYVTRAGAQTFSPFHYRAGRYVLLTFSKIAAPIRLDAVKFIRCDYPVRRNPGIFRSSCAALNKIAYISVNTLHLNMHSHFEDCPWREQKLYLGDLYFEALACYYSWGEYDYVRKNLLQLTARRREDGWIRSAGPGVSRGSLLPGRRAGIVDFPFHFIMELRDYHLFSGDKETLQGLYPQAARLVDNYMSMGVSRRGLIDIGRADSFNNWCVINWNDVVKKGECAAMNFLFARTLAAAGEMASWLNRSAEAARYRMILVSLGKAIDAAFWDSSRKLYRDSRFENKPINHFSTETNTLAVLSGLPDRRKIASILNAMQSGRLQMETPTAYFNAFVAEALFKARRPAAALGLIEKYWGKMIERGADAFWEMFLPETPAGSHPPKGDSLCHGWASGPAYLLPARVMGIRPLEPGFRRFTVDPQLAGLESAECSVPTPHGYIRACFAPGKYVVSHPRGTVPVVSRRAKLPAGTRMVIRSYLSLDSRFRPKRPSRE
ncbi:MAG: alpha-L-rhamnosidase C-terminal domain-containing protein [Kiritimatiellia bacterium]